MKLTKKEEAWLVRLEKCLDAAPISLNKKVSSYNIGDSEIILYDRVKQEGYEDSLSEHEISDKCIMVADCGSQLCSFMFPFGIESTAG